MKVKKRIVSVILTALLILSSIISATASSLDPAPSQMLIDNAEVAERTATEGIVLLENNNNALPIKDKSIALFGYGAACTYRGGSGSGDPWNGGLSGGGDPLANFNTRWHVNIYDAFKDAGYNVTTSAHMEEVQRRFKTTLPVTMGGMTAFRFPEPELTANQVAEAANGTDTAVYVISRNAGEGSDRSISGAQYTATIDGVSTRFYVGDYELLALEKENLRLLGETFKNVIVVINCGGQIDTNFFNEIPGLDSLIFMGQAGQEGGAALVKLLTGKANFSAKTINTWAKNYNDYPASTTFGNNDGTDNNERYVEGIYIGYRYFDTAGIEPAYPFGYGLSYTDFNINVLDVNADEQNVSLTVQVQNTGNYEGKEVVQVYYSAPDGTGGDRPYQTERAYQDLIVYGKTDNLKPGEKQIIELSFKTADMAYYNEKDEGYALNAGDYILRVGNSSRNTHVAAVLNLDGKVITEQLKNLMHTPWDILEEKGDVWSKTEKGWTPYTYSGEAQEISKAKVFNLANANIESKVHEYSNLEEEVTTYTTDPSYQAQTRGYQEYSFTTTPTSTGWTGVQKQYEEKVELVAEEDITLLDVYKGNKTLEQLVGQMSLYELATLNCGSGWGVWDELAPIYGSEYDSIPGCAAETTRELMDNYGIPFFVVNDGPGGLRVRHAFEATDVNSGEKVTVYNYSTAWPVSIVRSATWNLDLLYEVGAGFAKEMEAMGITQLLGTSLNIHRDPLCGRNFEYYSEDPVVSGYTVSAVTTGLQDTPGIGACIKHYAANQQETRRGGGNSVMSERTMREIYLKGFEIGIKSSQPMSIMTSYNLINNVPSADDYDLLNNITRDEWGYGGHIMTDWGGGRSTPAKSMHGGNDFITPGGTAQVRAIMRYFGEEGAAPVFKENGEVDSYLTLSASGISKALEWRTALNANGTNIVRAPLGENYTAALSTDTDAGGYNYILVNGERIIRTASFNTFRGSKEDAASGGVVTNPTAYVTTQYASVEDGGKAILYKCNNYDTSINICRGDLQKSAIANLKVIMQSLGAKKYFTGNSDVSVEPWASQFQLQSYYSVAKSITSTNKEVLLDMINEAEALIGSEDYNKTFEFIREYFNEALKEAKAVYNDVNATNDEVTDSFLKLVDSIGYFAARPANMDKLSLLVDLARGLNLDKYDVGVAAFQAALANAEVVLADPIAFQDEADTAYNTLLKAITAMRYKVNKTMLQALYDSLQPLDLSVYTADSVAVFRTAMANALAVLLDGDSTQDDVNINFDALNKAKGDLKPLSIESNAPSKDAGKTDPGSTTSKTDTANTLSAAANQSAPKTGDNSPFIGILTVAGLAFAMIIISKKKESLFNKK